MSAVVVAGSTGEAAALSEDERASLLAAVKDAVDVPVIAGTGAPSAHQAVRLTRAAVDSGADAVLALSPPGSTDVRPYYADLVAAARDMPVLAYHYPAVSPPGIPVSVLASLDGVAGAKDSTGDPERLLEELTTWDKPVYPGSSSLVSFAGQLGCPGAILALANAEPELCVAAFGGSAEAQLQLAPAHLAVKAGGFPAGIKAATARRWGTSTAARMG